MESTPKEMLKAYVDSQKFSSTTEIMDAMKEMFRDVLQQVMESEQDTELGYEKSQRVSDSGVENKPRNYRNGYSKKTVKTQLGAVDVKVPRDRNGEYEPQIIGKYSWNADGMEEKILALYSCGMSQRDIAEQIKELYDVEISPDLVTKITEKIMPEVTAWQNRALEAVYPFIFMDAIHYKVREDHRYVTKAAYVVLGITMDGRKDILGVWIGEHESSKFWLNVLNDLKSRGVLDVYLFCTDGLCGMMEAIRAVYPQSRLQCCIVHQIRSSTRFVSWKDIKLVVADLKKIYTSVTLDEAEENLLQFSEKWRKQYPSCVKSWEDDWEVLSTFYEYPPEVRKIIYDEISLKASTSSSGRLRKTNPALPTMIPCAGCFTWPPSALRSAGAPDARTGTWCSASWRSCSPTVLLTDPLATACALSIAPLLDFVEFRLHKILLQAINLDKSFLAFVFIAAIMIWLL